MDTKKTEDSSYPRVECPHCRGAIDISPQLRGLEEQLQSVELEASEYSSMVMRLDEQLEAAQKRVASHYYVDRDYHNDYVGRLEGQIAELKEQLEALREEIIAVRADCGVCNGGVTEADHHRGICPNCGHLWRLIEGESNPAKKPDNKED